MDTSEDQVVAASSSSSSSSSSESKSTTQKTTEMDKLYDYDEEHIELLQDSQPWKQNHKHFTQCKVSALASMKMLKHALAGVEKGRASAMGMSNEVMGLLVGKIEGDALVVLDACPLPVEGEANFVESGDEVAVYMATLMDSLDVRRKEGFVGWYHSHPFDVGPISNCHLSSTDVQMQTTFQMQSATWVGIVVDPLRSIAKQVPELGCYRVYPPSASRGPNSKEAPDGKRVEDKQAVINRWGHTWYNYYELKISYFMSSLSFRFLNVMSRNSLWIRVLSNAVNLDPDVRDRFPQRVKASLSELQKSKQLAGDGRDPYSSRGQSDMNLAKKRNHEYHQHTQASTDLAVQCCSGMAASLAKALAFRAKRKATHTPTTQPQ